MQNSSGREKNIICYMKKIWFFIQKNINLALHSKKSLKKHNYGCYSHLFNALFISEIPQQTCMESDSNFLASNLHKCLMFLYTCKQHRKSFLALFIHGLQCRDVEMVEQLLDWSHLIVSQEILLCNLGLFPVDSLHDVPVFLRVIGGSCMATPGGCSTSELAWKSKVNYTY